MIKSAPASTARRADCRVRLLTQGKRSALRAEQGVGTTAALRNAAAVRSLAGVTSETVDVGALIIGLASGSTIGAVVTALLTVSHERNERYRERALEATISFLAARKRAIAAVVEVQGRARVARSAAKQMRERIAKFMEMGQPLVEAARNLPQRTHGASGGEERDDTLSHVVNALYAVYDVEKAQQIGAMDVNALRSAVSDIDPLLPALTALPPPLKGFGRHLRDVLSDMRLALTAGAALEDAMEASAAATNALQEHGQMVRLLFAADAPDVVDAASRIIDGVSDATRSLLLDALSGADDRNEHATSLLGEAARAADELAVAVSYRVRPKRARRRGALRLKEHR